MRSPFSFPTPDGLTLRGWLYQPQADNSCLAPRPAIAMAHGFSAVKEMALDRFASAFCAAGFVVLVWDNRCFGSSDGSPRQQVDPWVQIGDYRTALGELAAMDDVDAQRLGVWGSSFSGGHAMVLAATDARVKCAVAQVPNISGLGFRKRGFSRPAWAALQALVDADRLAVAQGAEPGTIPVTSADPAAPCILPGPEAHAWFTGMAARDAPAWQNAVTLDSVVNLLASDPGAYLQHVSPVPLMLQLGLRDELIPADLATSAWQQAAEPKELVLVDCGHFEPYGACFDQFAKPAVRWFTRHL